MSRLLRRALAILVLAAPALLAVAPHAAHAFCFNCDVVNVIEYVNEVNGHYLLLSADSPEVALVERGDAGPGWQRTGNDFTTSTFATLPVCRFYSPVFNTHFYTADPTECALVKENPDWVYEQSPFRAYAPVDGSCAAAGGTSPLYHVDHAGDHRYTADARLRDAMLAKGWTDEGIGFCVRSGGREALETMNVLPTRIDSTRGCQASAGDCVALDALAPMPNRVSPYLPPFYTTVNPAYPTGLASLVGYNLGQDLYTSDASAILQHSFASLSGAAYIDGHERAGGDFAGISAMVELPGVAGTSGDQRVFVWRSATDRELRVSALAYVGMVAQDGPGSHAYGHPLIEFGDAKSGRGFLVTVQAYGTVPPGDFAGADARTGEPIVSTVFRPNPWFGSVSSGSFIPCRGDGSPCAPQSASSAPIPFVFSMRRADFQAAIDHARTVDPALSSDPGDYFLARVAFHNETYLDARLGATVSGLTAQIWYVE